ncbi:MerR family transcriptional regulator [Actinoalloteichus hymeniacidonis]|uniref:Transcriptional regulator n=1 Tax=Actinoalloteichus hymeniacidonis TaxID=340345 RepID=A0AAC9HMK0_9PSEU|nr:MerR family transcriptional regulator [Actinoalloteichus hymeniacidonis]AOS61931.1 putative transcriptional regulator [Actinoalloteichus hymeniacidonis]MBB5910049.1 DNA-binding transcriptional MerR regulator [Actinoalloteichus hymeniacidonis]
MAWSTRQVAELAGTTVRAVRHYHQVGLLDEPERAANGYKQYGAAHLVRLLRIKRLSDLGFSLAEIAEMGDTDQHPEAALRTLDRELEATIESLRRIRAELSLILQQTAPLDLPPGLVPASVTATLSETDRAMFVVMSRTLPPALFAAYAEVLQRDPVDPMGEEFAQLPADADERTRRMLAERMSAVADALVSLHPALGNRKKLDADNRPRTTQTIETAVRALYNPAQIDVLERIRRGVTTAPHRAPV